MTTQEGKVFNQDQYDAIVPPEDQRFTCIEYG